MISLGVQRVRRLSMDATDATPTVDEGVGRVLTRLRRVEGQVLVLHRKIVEWKNLDDVLTQLSAVKSALDRVGIYLISHRMRECLETDTGVGVQEESMEEAFEIFLK